MNYAPVLIPTLNRYEHFKRCVDTLARCNGAEKTDLFVALDYPVKPEHYEGHNKISIFVDGIKGFHDVKIVRRTVNFGVSKNLRTAREDIKEHYPTYIYTDDDNEFSPNFLEYINKGLEIFKDDPRIIAICGDGGTFEKPSGYDANYIYRKGFSAWGYGTWFDRDYKVDYSVEELKEFVEVKTLRRMLRFFHEGHFYVVLSHIYRNLPLRGDGAVALDMLKNDTYCVYPTISKVRNHGHDGSGEHGGNLKDSPFLRVLLDEGSHFEYIGDPVLNDKRYVSLLRKYSMVPFHKKLRFYLRMMERPKSLLEVIRTISPK